MLYIESVKYKQQLNITYLVGNYSIDIKHFLQTCSYYKFRQVINLYIN